MCPCTAKDSSAVLGSALGEVLTAEDSLAVRPRTAEDSSAVYGHSGEESSGVSGRTAEVSLL